MRCHEAQLDLLLHGDEDSSEFRNLSRHVEFCSQCRARLQDLAGDGDFEHEIRTSLGCHDEAREWSSEISSSGKGSSWSSVVVNIDPSIDSSSDHDLGAECEPVSLEFLSPASHPEMLGRIGRYDVERIIGSGGMGIVLKAFDTELHRVVAIKVLKPHLAHNGAARRRFAREAQSAAAVVHEHVTPIHDVLSDGETPFLVMQYVPGQSLQARVDERGPLPVVEILRIARQAAAGLAAAHAQGVVHRDVKPGNILLEESVERVLISDFGLARTVDDATLTRTGVVAGTPHYMSPEQASGLPVDQRSDLYSLGSVIYFMCTGRPPFRAEHTLAVLNRICHDRHHPVEDINSDVPAELADIVDCLLSKNPNDRFRDASEVEQRLATLLLELQHGRRSSMLHWKRLWRRRREGLRRAAFSAAVVLVCVLIGIGIAGWFSGRAAITRPTTPSESEKTSSSGPSVVAGSVIVSEPTVTELLIPNEPVTPREEVPAERISAPPDASPFPEIEVVAPPQTELPPDTFAQDLRVVHELMEKMGTGAPPAPFPAQTDSFNKNSPDYNAWTDELNRVREHLP